MELNIFLDFFQRDKHLYEDIKKIVENHGFKLKEEDILSRKLFFRKK